MTFIKPVATFFIFLLLLPASMLVAQDTSDEKPNYLRPGSKALQFQISENFNLESFSGSIISYKKQVSEDRARRIGLSLFNRINSVSRPDSEFDQEDSNFALGVNANYTWKTYTNPESEIKFYYGYGPGIGFGVNRIVRDQTGSKNVNQTLSVAVEGLGYAGVEWFFHSSMSLHAEYGGSVRVQYTNIKAKFKESRNEEVTNVKTTSVNLGGDGVRFGLSVYF